MTGEEPTAEPLEIVDAADFRTLSWGPLRVMFPRFAERVELERHVSALLASARQRVLLLCFGQSVGTAYQRCSGRDSS
jgi:hypothetical protein